MRTSTVLQGREFANKIANLTRSERMKNRLIELLQDIDHHPEKTCPKYGTGEECGDCQYKLETEKGKTPLLSWQNSIPHQRRSRTGIEKGR